MDTQISITPPNTLKNISLKGFRSVCKYKKPILKPDNQLKALPQFSNKNDAPNIKNITINILSVKRIMFLNRDKLLTDLVNPVSIFLKAFNLSKLVSN